MTHLHDVDVILKLAACDILQDLAELLKAEDKEIKVLPTAIHKIRSLGRQKKYEQCTIDAAVQFCQTHESIPDVCDLEILEKVIGLGSKMDPGEAVLYSVALELKDSAIVTGDKEAMRVIGRLDGDNMIRRDLQSRVICFEELLLRYRERFGFERLRSKCCEGPNMEKVLNCDNVLKVVFGSGMGTTEESCMEALGYYWDALQKDSGGLLMG